MGTGFLAQRSGAAQDNRNVQKMKMSGKVVQFPSPSFISCLFMTINIYKQCKIVGKAGKRVSGWGTVLPENDGGPVLVWHLSQSLKKRGKLLVTSLRNYIILWANDTYPNSKNNKRTRFCKSGQMHYIKH